MLDVQALPAVNATLNTISCLLLALGFRAIRRRQIARHRRLMLLAVLVSALFLASYLVYHFRAGSTPYEGEGPIRAVYYVVLVSHVVLAAAVVPLALVTLWRAMKGRFEAHKRVARLAWPVWIYVSLTGVLVYVLLYVL